MISFPRSPMRLNSLFVAFCVLFSIVAVRGQEASSEVVGIWEAQVAPGKFEPLAPLLLPTAMGGGQVDAVIEAGRVTPRWFGELPDPVDSALLWPRGGTAAGRALFGSPVAESSDWTYSGAFRGTPFAGVVAESMLQAGDSFSVIPLWTVEEFVGAADVTGVHTAATKSAADVVTFPGGSVWAARAEGGVARWAAATSDDPNGEDAGGSVLQDVNLPVGYWRSDQAPAGRRLTFAGGARLTTAAFPILPTPAGKETSIRNPVFRPDGREFTLANTLGLFSRSAALGLVGGRTADLADRLVIWSADIQEWEEFYYKTTAPIGWKSLHGRTVNPSSVKVPSGGVFYVIRPDSLPRIVLRLAPVSSAVIVNRSLFPQIVDSDRDRLADGWERVNGSANLSMQPGADLDGDGLTNLAEILLGGNPRSFDAPGRPVVQVRHLPSGSREVWLAIAAHAGCRYRVEKRMAGAAKWIQLGPVIVGNGVASEVKDPLPLNPVERVARFYRTVALTPADGDGDLLSDWEERNVYATNPAKRDTDFDGITDGAEVRAKGRDPLDYYDGRVVSFKVNQSTNGEVTSPGQWVRQALDCKVTSGKRALTHAPVTFVITRGSAMLSAVAGDDAGAVRTLLTRTDAKGVAQVFIKAGADPGWIEGSVSALVKGEEGAAQLYSGSWACFVSANLALPSAGLVRWFRPDSGITVFGNAGQVTSWRPVGSSVGSEATTGSAIAPRRVSESGRTWIQFGGKEVIDLGAVLPDDTFNAYFVAAPSGNRTAAAANISSAGTGAGVRGQCYLLAGATAPGQRVLVYDAPSKPSPRSFSTWEQTDFRYHSNYLDGPSGEANWKSTRPYDFPPARARYDVTTGYRLSPVPEGIHRHPGTANVYRQFLRGLGTHFANFQTEYEETSTREITFLGRVVARERFYQIRATTWRGSSSSSAFGGVARMDYSNLLGAGFGLSVGAQTSGAFELAQYYRPSVCPPAAHSPARGNLPRAAILASVRLKNRIPAIDVGGVRRSSGSPAWSRSPVVHGPCYLGGWDGSGNGYQGRLGDVVLYDRDLDQEERRTVEDVLAAAYRGVAIADRDRDGLRDWWERAFFGNSGQNARGDFDGDLSSNLDEQTWGTDPSVADTDGDGLTDKAEVSAKTNGLTWDTDSDFLGDAVDPLPRDPRNGRADANADGIPDGIASLLTNRSLLDTDGDSLCDLVEACWLLTSATLADSDGDGASDGDEVRAGTDPTTP